MNQTAATPQLERWTGEFGQDYLARNEVSANRVRMRTRVWARIWQALKGDPPKSILECGCNLGMNQLGLRNVTGAELFAIEPNPEARARAVEIGALDADHVRDGHLGAALPFDDASMELVFTSGVLIHVPPADLDKAYQEIHRVSSKYILAIEYFAKEPETIAYRGHDDLLFKRDFGGHWLDLYPELIPVDEGFFWNRTTDFDDATWWLFRKA